MCFCRGRAVVARLAHNQEAVGSNPTPATKIRAAFPPPRTDSRLHRGSTKLGAAAYSVAAASFW